jgi:outer membrane lipoprotein SlyB
MLKIIQFSPLLAIVLLSGCAVMPTGPSMLVLPGTGMSFNQFQNDDYACRQYAYNQIGGATANQAQATSGLASAAIGTAVGAAAGAAIGGGQGAAVGAGTGLLAGSLIGTGMANQSGYAAQQRYDNAYIQCMYANGHRVPVPGPAANSYRQGGSAISQSTTPPPPPPPGTPPPPPPR